MGTNYYAMIIPTAAHKLEMISCIVNGKWDDLDSLTPVKVHIGKSSGGWQFIFNHNDEKYYRKSRHSIDEFLRECIVRDEYDRELTADKFWEIVKIKKGDVIDKNSTVIDGLVFSDSTDFS